MGALVAKIFEHRLVAPTSVELSGLRIEYVTQADIESKRSSRATFCPAVPLKVRAPCCPGVEMLIVEAGPPNVRDAVVSAGTLKIAANAGPTPSVGSDLISGAFVTV